MKKLLLLFVGLSLGAYAGEPLFDNAHVMFKYDGTWFTCDKPVTETPLPSGKGWTSKRCEYRTPDGLLGVRVTWKFYTDYPAAEYLPELYATGDKPTKIVRKYSSLCFTRQYAGKNPRLDTATRIRTLIGDRCCNFPFVPQTHWLGEETTIGFCAVGRSSNGSIYLQELDRTKNHVEPLHEMMWPGTPTQFGYMPYFCFDFPEGDGLDLAIGWSGSWRCDCSKWQGKSEIRVGLIESNFKVLPGETLRTPAIVLMHRAPGISPRAFRTLKHRFIRAFKSPRDAEGKLFKPLMPLTSDGGMKTDQMMVDIIKWAKDNKLGRDGFWIDAGWNGYAKDVDPMKWTCWRKYHGSWTPNRVSHPDGNFKRVSSAAHAAGMKFILWCEPERVLPDSDLGKSLPAEALLTWKDERSGFKVLNLGHPKGCDAAIDTLSRLIDENAIDVYRQDCNMGYFAKFWEEADAPDRRGVSEMKYIAGLYRFWDTLRAKYPNLLIDNCASGGRRLDIELNARSHCYCRSDFFISYRGEDQISSAQNATLNTLDIQPFQGSESTPGKFGDEYGFFSATGPALIFTPGLRGYYSKEGITSAHLKWLQKMLPVCDKMRTYFQGDFYPQTEPTGLDRDVWCAYQMHRADLNAGFVMAFRRQEAPNDTLAVDLGGIDPNATYALENWDGTSLGTIRGAEFKTKPVKIAKKRDFSLVFYTKTVSKVERAGEVSSSLPADFAWANRFEKYAGNPIIRPQGKWAADMIFNPAAVVKDGRVGLLCRAVNLEDRPAGREWSVSSLIWAWSDDGIHFTLDDKPFLHPTAAWPKQETCPYPGGFEDPRIVYLPEAKTYVLCYTGVRFETDATGSGKWHTPALIAWSKDLKTWEWGDETFPNRAVCITPEKIDGKYWAYWDNSTLKTSWSTDLRTWHHTGRSAVKPRKGFFDSTLCEAVAAPVISDSGILLLYNGAMSGDQRANYMRRWTSCYATGDFSIYQVGWALFDRHNPERLIARSTEPIVAPTAPFERFGFVNGTVFASGLVRFRGRWMLYYGCADNRIGLATAPAE